MIYYITHTNFYSNWGDVAIDLASFILMDVNEIQYKVVNQYNYRNYKIGKNDTVCIRGGGFFGLYNGEPEKFLKQYMKIQCKKVILFPSSLYFKNENYNTIADIKNLNLIIFSRDSVSTLNYKKHFTNSKVLECPDMVLYFKKDTDISTNDNIKMIARGTEKRTYIENYKYTKFKYTNNFDWKNINISLMYKLYNDFKNDFKNTKYIITDSLHCCIFSYIFNRYCYAFDNKSGKVFNTLKSYFQNSNIKFCTAQSDITAFNFENKIIDFNYNNLIDELIN